MCNHKILWLHLWLLRRGKADIKARRIVVTLAEVLHKLDGYDSKCSYEQKWFNTCASAMS